MIVPFPPTFTSQHQETALPDVKHKKNKITGHVSLCLGMGQLTPYLECPLPLLLPIQIDIGKPSQATLRKHLTKIYKDKRLFKKIRGGEFGLHNQRSLPLYSNNALPVE